MTDDQHPTTTDGPGGQDPMARRFSPAASAPGPGVADGSAPPAAPPAPPAAPGGDELPSSGGAPPSPALTPFRPRRSRSSVVRRIVWLTLGVLVVALFVASRINLDYYAIQPGTAQSVQPFIKVPASMAHPVVQPVLLTDVQEARVNALSYLFFKLQANTDLYPLPAVTGGTAPSELDAQGALEMSQAEAAAKTAALRHLGYAVTATPAGSVIAGTFEGTPAFGVLNVGDVVTAVDGTPTMSAVALTRALAQYHSGQTVTFSVKKGGSGAVVPVSLTLRSTKVQIGGETVTLDVGIQPQDQIDYAYPFAVSIDVVNIGGPSAGLAMTLGVIDTLSGGRLTGGHVVAATGTMDADGNVGAVGGVPQKTVAVENAGATIFLVPPDNYADAVSKQRPGLKIYQVSTLDQALEVLAANGGQVPAPALVAAVAHGAG